MTSEAQLRIWFDQIDLDGNGLLSVREVQKCLALNHLTFSLTSTNMLMRLFDADHSGALSFNQFVVYGRHRTQQPTRSSGIRVCCAHIVLVVTAHFGLLLTD